MVDNSTEIKLKITNDKSGLANLKAEVQKSIAEIKGSYQTLTAISKQQAQIEITNLKTASQQKNEIIKKETALKKLETQQQIANDKIVSQQKIANDKIAYAESVRLIRQQESEAKRLARETAKQQKSRKGMSLFQGLEFGENLTVVAYGVSQVFNKVNQYISESINKALEFRKVIEGLQFATDSITFKGLTSFNEQFKTGSIYSTKDIARAETFLSLQGRTEEQIKKVVLASMDLSAVTGDDLDTSVRKLDMTFEGSIGRLGRMDERIKNLSTTELENGAAVDIIAEKYGGFANNQAETLSGKLAILEKNYEGLKRSFGDSVLKELQNQFDLTGKSAKDLSETFDKVKKGIDFVVFSFGTFIRIMPNLYSIGRNVNEMFSALGDILRFIKDPAYSFADAISSIWDKLSDTIPLLKSFVSIYKYFSPSESNTGAFTAPFDYTKKYYKEFYEKRFKTGDLDYNANLQPDKTSNKTSRSNRTSDLKDEKVILDDIQKLDKEIKDLKAEQESYLKKYPTYLGLQLKYTEDIRKKEEEIANLQKDYILNPYTPSKRDLAAKNYLSTNQGNEAQPYSKDFLKIDEKVKSFERLKGIMGVLAEATGEASKAFGELFGNLISNSGNSTDAVKGFMKSIVNTFITSIQAMIFASGGAAFAKGITSFGLSLITDLPLLAAAWVGLEAAKGIIGGLATGGEVRKSGMYLVGEQGPEIRYLNSGGGVINNQDTMRYINNPQSNNNNIQNNITVKVSGLLRDLVKVGIDQNNKRNIRLAY